jgi:site-specific recombinase XerC
LKTAIHPLRPANWPPADRRAWDDLFAEGDLLEGGGPARHWRPATRTSNGKAYGQWLGWLAQRNFLDAGPMPWKRATLERVQSFAADLMERRARRTVATTVIALKCVLIRMAPDADWRWLRDLTNRLDVWAGHGSRRETFDLAAPEMLRRALRALDRLRKRPSLATREALQYRDCLVVALLIGCPIRLKNLVAIEIGVHLFRHGDEWRLSFEGHETKNGHPVSYVVPHAVASRLTYYIECVRPRLARAGDSRRLWLATTGAPLAAMTIYLRTVACGKRLFGQHISPQAYRRIAATFLAESSASDALHARPLLGHRRGDTTVHHYIMATSLEASRRVANALGEIRDNQPTDRCVSTTRKPQRDRRRNSS